MALGRAFVCLLLLPTLGLGLAACGSKSSSSSAGSSSASSSSSGGSIALSISESGKTAKFTAPSTAKGGLVTVTLKNEGKMPHSAQLVLMKGNHTVQEVLKIVSANNAKTPSWLRAEGGVGTTAPGQAGTATVDLPAGHYGVFELPGPTSTGPPPSTEFQVTAGTPGTPPSAPTKVTAATAGKDRYKWQVSGALKPGTNKITFASKGSNALHLIAAVRLTGRASNAQLIKALQNNGGPPKFLDPSSFTQTAVLDGGKSSATELNLVGPGRYVLFCPLADRDGRKPHLAEGLITQVTIK
jgi:hypothetical protein